MKEYTFRVVIEEDDGRWFAYCPALHKYGAATWGETREEAFKHVREVVQMVVEELTEDGVPVPETPVGDPEVIREPHVMVAA